MSLTKCSELDKVGDSALHLRVFMPREFDNLDEGHDDHLENVLLTLDTLIDEEVLYRGL